MISTRAVFCRLLIFSLVKNAIAANYEYSVIDLGTLGGSSSSGYGINASSQIAGWSYTTSGSAHAFLYDGTMHDLGTLGGSYSIGRAINDSGQITGVSITASGSQRAFLYDGTMHDLGTLGGAISGGDAINASGQIIGYADTAYAQHPFLYDGTMHDLGTFGGFGSNVSGINASGWITGVYYTASGSRAFLYDGTTHDLGTLGGSDSGGNAINASGQITGNSATVSGSYHAFLYDGTMHDLGTLGGSNSYGSAINTSGQIVGYYDTATAGIRHAFLYDGVHGMRDLNSLIEPFSSTALTYAAGINDNGQIVANNANGHAVLLTRNLFWTGSEDNDWDRVTTNWADATPVSAVYSDGVSVAFKDRNPLTNAKITNTDIVAKNGSGTPVSVIFDNSGVASGGVDYTLSGTINAGGELVKNGTGTATLKGAAAFSSNVRINNGTMQVLGPLGVLTTSADLRVGEAQLATLSIMSEGACRKRKWIRWRVDLWWGGRH